MNWTVERLGRRGDGVAVAGATRALAPLVLPGEEIAGEAADGRIRDPRILTPSPHRVRAACPHYRACGGCSLMHAEDGFVAGWKAGVVAQALAAQRVEAPPAGPVLTSPSRSRRRAVLSGRRTRKGALVGFHARASDVVVDVTDCLVLRPALVAALPDLRALTQLAASRAGELSLAVTETPAGLDVTVTGAKPATAELVAAAADLAGRADWARLTLDGESLTRRAPALRMGRAQMVPPPGAFLQATAEGERDLLEAVHAAVAGAARIADLFAGVGTFALPLAEGAEILAVEGLAAPLAALEAGWRGAPGLHRLRTAVRDLARRPLLPDELAPFDAVVIDPPRAGAEAQARALAASGVGRIAWVSCDPVTFARDARLLTEGGYRLTRLTVVDQFRWSPHVETVASFQRQPG